MLVAATVGLEWLPGTSAIYDKTGTWRRLSDTFSRMMRRIALTGRGRFIDMWLLSGATVHASCFGSRVTAEREIGEVFLTRGSGEVTPLDFLGDLDEPIGYGSRYGALLSNGELPGEDEIAAFLASRDQGLLGVVGGSREVDEIPEKDVRSLLDAAGRAIGVATDDIWLRYSGWTGAAELTGYPRLERALDLAGVVRGGHRNCFVALMLEASASTVVEQDELVSRLLIDAVFERVRFRN